MSRCLPASSTSTSGPTYQHRRRSVGDQWVIERSDNHEGDIEVYITGIQSPDGLVDRKIAVSPLHWGNPITPQQASKLARALIAATGECERLSEVMTDHEFLSGICMFLCSPPSAARWRYS